MNMITKQEISGAPASTNPHDVRESEAIRLACNGDPGAFERLYGSHIRRVHRMCARMTGNPSEAEDLAQEVFLRVFLTLHSFRGESSFSTWLYRLTFNVVLMGIRKKRHSEISLDAQVEEGISRPVIELSADARLSAMPDRINLNRAIDRLPHGIQGEVHSP